MPAAPPTSGPKTSASFTSWKMDLLNAASADPRIPPTHFRLLVRIAAALNQETRVAMLGDDVIADEVPGFAQQSTRYRARKALAELGYLEYEAGSGTRVTRYRISDKPVPAILSAIAEARERRNQEREKRNADWKATRSNPASVQARNADGPCKSHPSNPAPMQSVHLQGTPSPLATRHQGETQGAQAHEEPIVCSMPECGCRASVMALRAIEATFRPYCRDCAMDDILSEVRQLDGSDLEEEWPRSLFEHG